MTFFTLSTERVGEREREAKKIDKKNNSTNLNETTTGHTSRERTLRCSSLRPVRPTRPWPCSTSTVTDGERGDVFFFSFFRGRRGGEAHFFFLLFSFTAYFLADPSHMKIINSTHQHLPLGHARRRRGHLRRPSQPRRDARRRARRCPLDEGVAGWHRARGLLLPLLCDLGCEFSIVFLFFWGHSFAEEERRRSFLFFFLSFGKRKKIKTT